MRLEADIIEGLNCSGRYVCPYRLANMVTTPDFPDPLDDPDKDDLESEVEFILEHIACIESACALYAGKECCLMPAEMQKRLHR